MKLKLDLPGWNTPDGCEPPEPPERQPRLTIETPWAGDYQARVLLDETLIYIELGYTFEQEALAAAEAYKAELLAHFRSGGE